MVNLKGIIMKNYSLFSTVLCFTFLFILVMGVIAEDPKTNPAISTKISDYKHIDINTISACITNYGSIFRDPATGNSGFEWPKDGGVFAIFASGLWIGAKVNNDVRVAVAEYDYEYRPGTIDPVTHQPNDPNLARYMVYKYQPGDVISPEAIADGCPTEVWGDQMLWSVYNEADSAAHIKFGTSPLGVEIQQTVFGWSMAGPADNLVMLRWLIINRGIETLDSAYISIWSDPDLGDYSDDFVGCDTTLSLGFCYNSTDYDAEYGAAPPAVGYDFFQGPIVASPGDTAVFMGKKIINFKNLPMTSFAYYNNSTQINGNPQTGPEAYNYMQAKWRDGSHMTYGGDGTNPANPLTNFMFTGDPESGTGWLDTNPEDRRFIMNTGPFTMAPGDSQEIITGVMIARGANNLASVTLLKQYSNILQLMYEDSMITSIKRDIPISPVSFKLNQNYPNPFNPTTAISYQLPAVSQVELSIYNLLGQKVATLVSKEQSAGTYQVEWDAGRFSSGIYLCSLQAGTFTQQLKMLLVK